ncbi:MAG: PIN domain-containing protein [Anaerolineae bacterium]|nr:PIN domain-containing protein [Anaerolineae bacterium]
MVFLEDEEGAQRVETLLRNEEVFLPFLALLETYYITLQEQPEDVADKRYALLKQLPATILWSLDEPSLLTAGRLKATYHVSLADALIAAMAIRNKAVLVHKDPEIAALSGIVQMETLPFKKQI